jgi:hypothetical protein
VKKRKHKSRRHLGAKAKGAAISPKAAAAVDALQSTCDRRMARANEAGVPTAPLFHYTNETALFSILDSNQFWFTSIYHMDDPEELNFGFTVARSLFSEAAKRSKGLARRFFAILAADSDLEKLRELIAFYSVGRDRTSSRPPS